MRSSLDLGGGEDGGSGGVSSTGSGGGSGGNAEYNIQDTFIGNDFNTGFQYWNEPDPTNGRVNYVDQPTAQQQNLSFASSDTFIMRADSWSMVDPSGPGRNSVRIQSNNQYTTHVAVLDLRHMPSGCATWPAFWECGENWPAGGEVDILEGANGQGNDLTSLHTAAGCTQPASGRTMKGSPGSLDCVAADNGNTGCGVSGDSPQSFGDPFNQAQGGWYVMERTPTQINVWFWGRGDSSVPADVAQGNAGVSPSGWGTPTATFVSDTCDISSLFGPNNIIINLTLCGDWAGNTFGAAGCPGDCIDYVNSNPSAFTEAYWDIAALRVYV